METDFIFRAKVQCPDFTKQAADTELKNAAKWSSMYDFCGI